MRWMPRILVLALLLGAAPMLAGCENFDPDSLDIFHLNDKKKLPGERRELFPGGVPGVTQGVPPEYLKGNQSADAAENPDVLPPASKVDPGDEDAAAALKPDKTAAVTPDDSVKPKPKPKRKPKPKPAEAQHKPAQVTIQPAAQAQQQTAWPEPSQQQQQQQQPQQAQSPWPDPNPPAEQSPWPSAPAPGTFSH